MAEMIENFPDVVWSVGLHSGGSKEPCVRRSAYGHTWRIRLNLNDWCSAAMQAIGAITLQLVISILHDKLHYKERKLSCRLKRQKLPGVHLYAHADLDTGIRDFHSRKPVSNRIQYQWSPCALSYF